MMANYIHSLGSSKGEQSVILCTFNTLTRLIMLMLYKDLRFHGRKNLNGRIHTRLLSTCYQF